MKYLCCIMAAVLFTGLQTQAAVIVDLPYNDVAVYNERGTAVFTANELYGEPGQPNLPVYVASVLLPPNADLNTVFFSIEGLKEEAIAGQFDVEPALPPTTILGPCWPERATIVNGRDVDAYAGNELAPKQLIKTADIGIKFVYKIARAQVNLARYNPATKTLFRMTSGRLVVNFKAEAGYTASNNRGIIVPEIIASQVRGLVSNFNSFAEAYTADFTFTKAPKMAIITTTAIKTGATKFNAFIESKKKRGIEVVVATETEWGGGSGDAGALKIRKWLQANYQTLGLHHVLLIGHYTNDVPMYKLQGAALDPGDYAFSQLNGDDPKTDKICEVSVGRIPVYGNFADLDKILSRAIAFESANQADIAWRKNALFGAGGYSSASKGDKVFNGAHDDLIVKTPPWKDYRIYGTAYGQSEGTPDKIGISEAIFSDQWSTGSYGVIDWCTHGAPTLAQYVVSTTSLKKVTDKYPGYALCGSCSNASPSNANNLSYSILRDCGMGAIGGTDLTYYMGDFRTGGSDEAWAYNFAKFLIVEGREIGDVISGLRDMAPTYGWNNRVPYVLYADPSIGLNTYNGSTEIVPSVNNMNPNQQLSIVQTRALIRFNHAASSYGTTYLAIYKASGTVIATIVQSAGKSSTVWNRRTADGHSISTGLYFVQMIQQSAKGSQIVSNARFIIK